MERGNKQWTSKRIVKTVILTGIGMVALALVLRLSAVFLPVAFALLLAYILEPVITFMDHHHSRRGFTVSFVYVLFLVSMSGVAVLVVPPLVDQSLDFLSYVKEKSEAYGIPGEIGMGNGEMKEAGEGELEGWWENLFSGKDDAKEDDDMTAAEKGRNGPSGEGPLPRRLVRFIESNTSMLREKLPILLVGGVRAVVNGAGNVATFVTQVVLALFYAFFFMLHFSDIRRSVAGWIPPAHRQEACEVFGEIDDVVAGFFRGRLLVCVISSFVMSIGLLISGIDFWLLLGIAAGFLGIIPFIGVTLTLIPALLIAFTSDQVLFSAVGVLVTFGVVQGFIEPFVGPFVISSKVRLHPVTVTVAFMAGGVLFGVLGLLLAIPACGILKILSRRYLAPALRSVV